MSNIAQLGFEHMNPKFKIDKPVRLIELFAGIGSQAKALQNLGVDFEKWIISEWEVNPTKSYKAIHHENDNTDYSKGLNQKELINSLFKMGISNDGKKPMTMQQIARKNEKWLRETYNAYKATHNISNIMSAAGSDLNIVDTENYIYIMTYSFPCQDLSIAGKQAGMAKGSQTRSGTLWEVERLLNECTELPQVLLMENVTQVHSKANIADFTLWQDFLKSKGYTNFVADLNAKDYEVPQNRNRCFMVSLLGDYSYTFPLPKPLTKRLKDILETDVDEKYYLSDNVMNKFKAIKGNGNEIGYIEKGTGKHQSNTIGDDNIARTLQATDYRHIPMILQVTLLYPNSGNPQAGRVYDADGLCCSIDTAQGGNRMPKIIEEGDTLDIAYPNSKTRRGRHIKGMAHTVTCENNSQVVVVDDTYKNRAERQYDDCCPALRSGRSGFKVQTEPCIAASRGRNPDNPNDRTAGIELQQRLEIKTDGTSNTLTTLQKDNLVVEPMALDEQNGYIRTDGCVGTVMTDGSSPKHNNRVIEPVCINSKDEQGKQPSLSDRVYKSNAISTAITTAPFYMPNYLLNNSRVRKLTPKECFRLMTFDDVDYKKCKAAGLSDSALYKQAGNSIVVKVLMAIFKELI